MIRDHYEVTIISILKNNIRLKRFWVFDHGLHFIIQAYSHLISVQQLKLELSIKSFGIASRLFIVSLSSLIYKLGSSFLWKVKLGKIEVTQEYRM